jgi:hypothetical protein
MSALARRAAVAIDTLIVPTPSSGSLRLLAAASSPVASRTAGPSRLSGALVQGCSEKGAGLAAAWRGCGEGPHGRRFRSQTVVVTELIGELERTHDTPLGRSEVWIEGAAGAELEAEELSAIADGF